MVVTVGSEDERQEFIGDSAVKRSRSFKGVERFVNGGVAGVGVEDGVT